MTTMWFALVLATILIAVVAIEDGERRSLDRPAGLLRWFVTGNWPAKIGAALMVIGVAALLRYAAIEIDLAPSIKLSTGVAAAAVLGFLSTTTGAGVGRRTLSLVLAGAAFGVAYLTAYSAFAIFGYVGNALGLGLLGLTALGAGWFAVARGALSLAVLAMIGAWTAPVFSVSEPGPQVVYGYYLAASALTLVMITLRGWRPLIHLSFIFTLVGGVGFAWNADYLAPQHFHVMSAMLPALVALHVAMPLVERTASRSGWFERLDLIYLLALPLVAAGFAFAIAPTRTALAAELCVLGGIWLVAAAALRIAAREGALAHAAIGALLMICGVATRFHELPWDVLAIAIAVMALAVTVRSRESRRLHTLLAAAVLTLSAVHALEALTPHAGRAFINGSFYEQLTTAVLLIIAARLCRKVGHALEGLLLCAGVGWAILTVVGELTRLDDVSVALVLHWMALASAIAAAALSRRFTVQPVLGAALVVAAVVTGVAAAASTVGLMSWITLLVAPLAMIASAVRSADADDDAWDRLAAVLAAPVLAGVWTHHISQSLGVHKVDITLAVTAAAAGVALLVGFAAAERSRSWSPVASRLFAGGFAAVLTFALVVRISRDPWAIATEALCFLGLILIAKNVRGAERGAAAVHVAVFAAGALLAQAHLIRLLGPAGDLNVADIARIDYPVLISLLWAAIGALLTAQARLRQSRSLWAAGAAVLIAAAVKLVLIDIAGRIDALGDLTTILAVIAAGAVFLLVGWFAPMPPAAPSSADDEAPVSPDHDHSSERVRTSAPDSVDARPTAAAPMQSASSTQESAGFSMPESYWKRSRAEREVADVAAPATRRLLR